MGTQYMTSMEDEGVSNEDIILDNTKLQKVDSTKFLGVTIDENLSWKNHFDGITKTISSNIGMINKLEFFFFFFLFLNVFCQHCTVHWYYRILTMVFLFGVGMQNIFRENSQTTKVGCQNYI